ncbi:ScbA/BarX family gamma-butyrolactone biosynthesis protein [Streptomyces sp. NPDC088674]|uniref:ScbA/BarX family gamma-butyrolactone biosynthesis protein n=1 Tax=Streptomyces sp. NPDC088674 TaxID=3365869 RepID=UPI00382A51D4
MSGEALTRPSSATLLSWARKVRPEEAFVREWSEKSPTEYQVSLDLPRSHAFYTAADGSTSPLLLIESIRQALAVLSCAAQGIPSSHRLGWNTARYAFTPAAGLAPGLSADVLLHVRHTEVSRRRQGAARLAAHIRATSGGTVLVDSAIRYTAFPPLIYDRLRKERADAKRAFARALPPPPPVSAALVGRTDPRDVVIAPASAPHEYRLRLDTRNEVLFDHPHDHVPGMVLLEGVLQAVRASMPGHAPLVGLDSTYARYVELDSPCLLSVIPLPDDEENHSRARVVGVQNGREAFASTVRLAPAGLTPGSLATSATESP